MVVEVEDWGNWRLGGYVSNLGIWKWGKLGIGSWRNWGMGKLGTGEVKKLDIGEVGNRYVERWGWVSWGFRIGEVGK